MTRFRSFVTISGQVLPFCFQRERHESWLLETGQEEKAGQLKVNILLVSGIFNHLVTLYSQENEGQYMEALNLYLRGGLATRASRLIQNQRQLMANQDTVDRVTTALLKVRKTEKNLP